MIRTGTSIAILALALHAPAMRAQPANPVVNSIVEFGDPTCETTCTLRTAINVAADGGTITFDPAILPAVITLQQGALKNYTSVNIIGPGPDLLAIDGNLTDRVFDIRGEGGQISVLISGVSLINGVYRGPSGSNGAPGTGDPGSSPFPPPNPYLYEGGGCIRIWRSSLTLIDVGLRNCLAQGGKGGDGGSGTTNSGAGGHGGNGNSAAGGAIYATTSTLVLSRTSIINAHAIGGDGGKGGNGGTGNSIGPGGAGGDGGTARGGAIFDRNSFVYAINVTVGASNAGGGKGGNGGSGDPNLNNAGAGGDGGGAWGGLYAQDDDPQLAGSDTFAFSTLGGGRAIAGLHGSGGRALISGNPGIDGVAVGAALQIVAPDSLTTIEHSAIFGPSAIPLCSGPVSTPKTIAADASCNTGGSMATLDGWYRILDEAAALPAYIPRFGNPAIDSTDCNRVVEYFGSVVNNKDMNATPRPQGIACDLGAIESDYIFVGEFE